MAFIKLDCGILNSTIWLDRTGRELFITALLMAEPTVIAEPTPQLMVQGLEPTGWFVPPGEYGFVPAASLGIIDRAGFRSDDDVTQAMRALERLGSPEVESRTPDHEGRRLVRVARGFIVLNWRLFRDRDHGAANRMRRLRLRKQEERVTP